MIKLKERCVYARPLGIIRCDHDDDGIDELLVVYDGEAYIRSDSSSRG